MFIYMIYEKPKYKNLNLISKIINKISNKSIIDGELVAISRYKRVAEMYVRVNYNNRLYIKETIISDTKYNDLFNKYNDKIIRCYKYNINGESELIIVDEYCKQKLLEQGVEFYDYSE